MKNQFFVIVDKDDSDKFRQFNYNTYGKLLGKLGYSNSRFWAFSDNDKENFEKIEIGDTIYFAVKGDHTFSFSAKVSGKEESDLAEKVFGDGFRQKITKSILFFNEFFVASINYSEMLRSTEQESIDKSGLYFIQNKFEDAKEESYEVKGFEEKQSIPVDHAGPPPKIQATTTRYIRDTAKTRMLKLRYENKCQVCNYQIIKPNNEYYSEVHHIWPLQNGGDDDFDNMLVLCPTHHAEFDYNVIRISKDGKNIIDKKEDAIKELIYIDGHKTAQKNIDQQFLENIK